MRSSHRKVAPATQSLARAVRSSRCAGRGNHAGWAPLLFFLNPGTPQRFLAVRRFRVEISPIHSSEELRLTDRVLLPIIVCTSILRPPAMAGPRGKKSPARWFAEISPRLHGWRQNIFLLPAVLFPHLARAFQPPPSVVS